VHALDGGGDPSRTQSGGSRVPSSFSRRGGPRMPSALFVPPPPQAKLAPISFSRPKRVILAPPPWSLPPAQTCHLVPQFPRIYVIGEVGPLTPFRRSNMPSWPPRSWPMGPTSHLGRGQLPRGGDTPGQIDGGCTWLRFVYRKGLTPAFFPLVGQTRIKSHTGKVSFRGKVGYFLHQVS